MLAIWSALVLFIAALAAAMTLTWRRHAAQPVRAKVPRVEDCGCYPRVKR